MVQFRKAIQDLNVEKVEENKMKFNKIKAKVMTIARINLILKKEQENKELIAEAKKMYPNGKLPVGAILDGLDKTKDDLRDFLKNQQKDMQNEKFPLAAHKRVSLKKKPGL